MTLVILSRTNKLWVRDENESTIPTDGGHRSQTHAKLSGRIRRHGGCAMKVHGWRGSLGHRRVTTVGRDGRLPSHEIRGKRSSELPPSEVEVGFQPSKRSDPTKYTLFQIHRHCDHEEGSSKNIPPSGIRTDSLSAGIYLQTSRHQKGGDMWRGAAARSVGLGCSSLSKFMLGYHRMPHRRTPPVW